ncbi:MAG: efflux RND transporter permease subunit [Thermostichales cyanobacterium BF4_bins_65]
MFSISGLAIRRHIGTLMLTLAVLVVGLYFAARLPVDLLPGITYPRIGVRLNAPGLDPEVAVQQITRPLEDALSTTDGVTQVVSRTREGSVSVDLFFPAGYNIEQALNDVTAAYGRAQGRLPAGIEAPRIFRFDPSQLPVYEFALNAPGWDAAALRRFGELELARELAVVPGVATVDVVGGEAEEISVQVNLPRLQSYGLSLGQILDALRQRHQDISAGRLRGSRQEWLTRTLGQFATVTEIAQLPLTTTGIRLQDVAAVERGPATDQLGVRLNQVPALRVTVQKQGDANTIAVVTGVRAKIEQLRQTGLIQPEMELVVTTDEAVFIRNAIDNVVGAAVLGSVLAGGAVFLFLGSLRQTLIILLAIPLTSLAALILMGMSGLSINIFSLGGLALGVGIVVDNAIVMLEHIAGHWRPDSTLEDAIHSSQQVESALLASTATNLAAVVPFLFVGGLFSLLFRELILTVCFAVGSSLLMAVTVVPMVTSRVLGIPYASGIGRSRWWQGLNRRINGLINAYGRVLFGVINRRGWVVAGVVVCCLGTIYVLSGQLKQEILPRIATGQVVMDLRFPPGTSLATNQGVTERVERAILEVPGTQYLFLTVGGSAFGSNVSVNPTRSGGSITLSPGTNLNEYLRAVNQRVQRLGLMGVRVNFRPGQVRGLNLGNSPSPGAELDVTLQGDDPLALHQAASQVLAALDQNVTLASFRPDGEDRQPEIQIRPDWLRVNDLGLAPTEVGQLVATALQGSRPIDFQDGENLIPVRVRVRPEDLQSPEDLRQLPILTRAGGIVQLQDLATVSLGVAPAEIQRINKKQVVVIAGNLAPGATLGPALAQVDQVMAQLTLPAGVTRAPSDAASSARQLQTTLLLLGSLAVFLVFTVMAVQYNSLVDPLVILLTVPLSVTGGVIGLWATNTPVGATVMVGGILLVGLVVNNAILMVELANQIRLEQGIERRLAILQAAPLRLRPILMTTITTVLGLYPLAAGIGLQQGGEFLQPLGVFVFWGLAGATGLTLFIIPCFYVLVHDWVAGIQAWLLPKTPVARAASSPATQQVSRS